MARCTDGENGLVLSARNFMAKACSAAGPARRAADRTALAPACDLGWSGAHAGDCVRRRFSSIHPGTSRRRARYGRLRMCHPGPMHEARTHARVQMPRRAQPAATRPRHNARARVRHVPARAWDSFSIAASNRRTASGTSARFAESRCARARPPAHRPRQSTVQRFRRQYVLGAHVRDEPVAALRDGLDVHGRSRIVAERLAQPGHVDREDALLDKGIRPPAAEQICLVMSCPARRTRYVSRSKALGESETSRP